MALVKEFHGAGTGVLPKVEAAGTAGHEPIIRTEEDTLCMIPYHAVMTVSFASRDLDISPGTEPVL